MLMAHDAALGQAQPQSSVLIVRIGHFVQTFERCYWLLAEQQTYAHVIQDFVVRIAC